MNSKVGRAKSLSNFNNALKISKSNNTKVADKVSASTKNLIGRVSSIGTETRKNSTPNSITQLHSSFSTPQNNQNKALVSESPLKNSGKVFVFGNNKSNGASNSFSFTNEKSSQSNSRSTSIFSKPSTSSTQLRENKIQKDTLNSKRILRSSIDFDKLINENKKQQIQKVESEKSPNMKSIFSSTSSNSIKSGLSQSHYFEESKKKDNENLKNFKSHQHHSENYSDPNLSKFSESNFPKSEASDILNKFKGRKEIMPAKNQSIDEKDNNKSSTSESGTSNCSSCKSIFSLNNPLFKTPKCEVHQYCNSCISNNKFSRYCTHCYNYLRSTRKQQNSNQIECSLCISFPESRHKGCKIHSYCNECFKFLINNDFSHIKKPNECEDCIKLIKSLKKCETPRTPNEIKSNQEKTIILGFNRIETRTNFNPDSARNKLIKQSENSLFSMSGKNGFHKEAKNSIEMAAKRNKPKIESKMNSVRNLNENIKCCICEESKNIKGFLCNHNACSLCLVGSCCKAINTFFTNYQLDPKYALNAFSYLCPKPDCDNRISVPTLYVISKLISYLSDPKTSEYFKKFSNLADLENIQIWIPYFDGLGSHIFY